MNFSRRRFLGAVAAGSAGLVGPPVFASVQTGVQPDLLPRALAALDAHRSKIVKRDLVGIVDFSAHSRLPRFHLVDIANGRIDSSLLVAHGRGSDPVNTGFVQKFSNRHGSNASSSGSFLTGETYYGRHGRSRRLIGLDPENSEAWNRAIVIHGANYVDPGMAQVQGRIGRSQGCFAFSYRDISEVLRRIGPGHLIYASK